MIPTGRPPKTRGPAQDGGPAEPPYEIRSTTMSDGTVKVTAEAHLHITQLMNLLQGPLGDVLSQVTSHGLALTDPNVWAGPAASVFSNNVWPVAQTQLDQVRATLTDLHQQV